MLMILGWISVGHGLVFHFHHFVVSDFSQVIFYSITGFLRAEESSCARVVRNIEVQCSTSESWNMFSYIDGLKFLAVSII